MPVLVLLGAGLGVWLLHMAHVWMDPRFLPLLLLLVFLAYAGVMMTRLLPALLALPLMALTFAVTAGFDPPKIMATVVTDGAARLSGHMVLMMLGGVLAELVNRSGITKRVVVAAAELGGEKPFLIGLVLCGVSELLFTVLGGLGSIIMVGSVILPVLLSTGFRPLGAGVLFLMALSFGGILNIANWGLYLNEPTLHLTAGQIMPFGILLFVIANVAMVGMLFWETRRRETRYFAQVALPKADGETWLLGPLAYFTPVLPILIIGLPLLLQKLGYAPAPAPWWMAIPPPMAFLLSIGFGFVATYRPGHLKNLVASVLEGVQAMAPVLVLIMGIGMLLMVAMDPMVKDPMVKTLDRIFPSNLVMFMLVFGLLAPPLSLYRGPFNMWGMGAGLFAVIASTGLIEPALGVVVLFLSAGQVQGACDPTNTHNVWVANYLKVDVNDLLKQSLLPVWLVAFLGLCIGAVWVGIRF